jgi:hypothetical protein
MIVGPPPGLAATGPLCLENDKCRPEKGCVVEARISAAPIALDRDDFGSNRSKVINVIDSNRLERDAGEKVLTLFLVPL